jgi:hypothetical protein
MEQVELNRVIQIGIVVPDRDKVVDNFIEFFGWDKEKLSLFDSRELPEELWSDMKYKGEPVKCDLKIATMNYRGIQWEIIEPVGDEVTEFSRFLKDTGGKGGLHHLCYAFKDTPSVIDHLLKKNVPVVTEGNICGKEFRYFDLTKELGLVFEILDFDDDYVEGITGS